MKLVLLAISVLAGSIRHQETPSRKVRKPLEKTLKVAVKADADEAALKTLKERFERAAKAWWDCTEGNMYFSKITIVDKTEDGDVIIERLEESMHSIKLWGMTWNNRVYVGGRFPIVTFCHEMGHRWFDLPDEYNEPKCKNCAMEPWKGVFEFCDDGNHTGRGEDCWTRILRKYPEWKRSRDYGDCPPVKVTIENK